VVVLAAGLDSRAYRLSWPDGTTIFELDRPQILNFKRAVLAGQGVQPRAERREVAVDLREDWPRALRDSGFDAAKPSAWIAEGLLIYLPAAAEEQLFTGIDSLSCPGSHVAVEDGAPLAEDEYEARLEEERSSPGQRAFFQLVYNERHAPATEWFGNRGWTAVPRWPTTCAKSAVRYPDPNPNSGPRSPVTPWSAPSRNDRPLNAGTFPS
jgi:methyltransferase (TIGR00027 family)